MKLVRGGDLIQLVELRLSIAPGERVRQPNGAIVLEGRYAARRMPGGRPGIWVLDKADGQWNIVEANVAIVALELSPTGAVLLV